MNKAKYIPQPIDTSDVNLPEELEQLVEQMSKNVHEVWAETRIQQGWRYGEQRNDELKTHPCLVPYEELPEEDPHQQCSCLWFSEELLHLQPLRQLRS